MRLFLHIIAERGRAGRHGQKAPLTWIPETMTTGWKGIAADAWESPGWREAAREYHNVRGGHPLIVETPAEHLAQLRRLLCHGVSLNVACDELNRAARERSNEEPKTTYDAVVYEMRTYGIPQLSKPSCQRRLADLSATQIGTVMASLQATRNQYPKVNNELLKALGRITAKRLAAMTKAEHEIHVDKIIELERSKRQYRAESGSTEQKAHSRPPTGRNRSRFPMDWHRSTNSIPNFCAMRWRRGLKTSRTDCNVRLITSR